MNKNLLSVNGHPDHEEEEKEQIRVVKSEYVTGLNSTLKNNQNLQSNLIKNDNQTTVVNKNQNSNYDDFSNVRNPLEDDVNPLSSQYPQHNAPLPNPMKNNIVNPLVDNNQGQPSPFTNYQNQYSQPYQNSQQGGYPNQGYQNSYNYQPPQQYNSPYQQPPQQFNVSYPGQNNLSQDQVMYRSQNSNNEGFQVSEEQKKYLIIGIIVCLILIVLIF